MTWFRTSWLSRDRGLPPLAWAGAALVLSGVLAYAAVDAARSQRMTAQAVLNDYASFAAEQFSQRFTQDVEYYGLYPSLQMLASIKDTVLPDPITLLRGADARLRQSLELADYFFRFNGDNGRITTGIPSAVPSSIDALRRHLSGLDGEGDIGALTVADTTHPRTFFFLMGVDGTKGRTAVGFAAKLQQLEEYSRSVFERIALLPKAVTGELPNDSIVAISVLDTRGNTLWTLPNHPLAIGRYPALAARPMSSSWQGLQLRVAIVDAATNTLVAGGFPTSRVPLTVGLAVVTAAMLTMTFVQLLRERELGRLRTEFVSSVSHELRTPLAQIRMFAETLKLGRMRSGDEQDRALEIIDKEARRLTNLVENVLQFSRAERNELSYAPTQTDLSQLVVEVVNSYRPLAESQGMTIETACDPVAATVDRAAIQQAILNLLDNAVKYGPPGQTVRISLSADGDEVHILVEDEGPGIPPAQRHAVWNRFTRLERDRQSATAGAGIGLAVVRDLVTAHDGRCWVDNGRRGARFSITVPRESTTRSPQADRTTQSG